MGFWSFITGGPAYGTPTSVPAIVSPWSPPSHLEEAIVSDIWGDLPSELVTRESLMRVAVIRRGIEIHGNLIAGLPMVQVENGEPTENQPAWLSNTKTGIAPSIRTFGIVKDLQTDGWACLGFELGEDGYPVDALHIPAGFWEVDNNTGKVEVHESISRTYTQRVILIPTGMPGLLQDGADLIRQARALGFARKARLDSPPPGTELHITDKQYDEMTREEKRKLSTDYAEQRRLNSVSVTPSYIEVKDHSHNGLDLFSQANNDIRLDLANALFLPASILEGSKTGGSGSDINYSNEAQKRSELWDFGTSFFARAIEARLSLDDVTPPGTAIRFDRTELMAVPTPPQAIATED